MGRLPQLVERMSNLPGFSPEEQAKPPSKRELAQQAKEVKALRIWYQTQDEGEVRKALKLPSNAAARVMINRAVETWHDAEKDHVRLMRTYQDHLLRSMLVKLHEKFEEGELQRTDPILKVWERLSKLLDLDAGKEETGGPQIVVVKTTPPWLEGEEATEIKRIGEGE